MAGGAYPVEFSRLAANFAVITMMIALPADVEEGGTYSLFAAGFTPRYLEKEILVTKKPLRVNSYSLRRHGPADQLVLRRCD